MDEYEQQAKGLCRRLRYLRLPRYRRTCCAYRVTGEKKYLDCAVTMADFHEHFDTLPVGHSHGSISARSAVMLYEETNDKKYLDRVLKRWDEAVYQGFVNPSGGVCENYIVCGHSDEGALKLIGSVSA